MTTESSDREVANSRLGRTDAEQRHLGRKVHAKPAIPMPAAMLSPKAAVDMLAPQFCSRKAAKEHLVDLLKDKRMKLYAQRYWVADEAELRELWDTVPVDVQTGVRVRKGIFSRSATLYSDAEKWDWEGARFFVNLGAGKLALMDGCEFDEKEIAYELRGKRGKGGRKRDDALHTDLWLRIVDAACDQGRDAFRKRQLAARYVLDALKSTGGPDWPKKRREGARSTLDGLLTRVRTHLDLARRA